MRANELERTSGRQKLIDAFMNRAPINDSSKILAYAAASNPMTIKLQKELGNILTCWNGHVYRVCKNICMPVLRDGKTVQWRTVRSSCMAVQRIFFTTMTCADLLSLHRIFWQRRWFPVASGATCPIGFASMGPLIPCFGVFNALPALPVSIFPTAS